MNWGVAANIAALLISASPAAAFAQNCELHVWPSGPIGSVYFGWTHGAVINGAVKGNPNYPKIPVDAIDTSTQVMLLQDVATLLERRDDRAVIHDRALESRALRATPGRIVPGTSCYAELIVDKVMINQDVVNGSKLMVMFRFRDFGSANMPARTFMTAIQTPVKSLKLTKQSDMAAATRELRDAFKDAVKLFGIAMRKAAAKAKL